MLTLLFSLACSGGLTPLPTDDSGDSADGPDNPNANCDIYRFAVLPEPFPLPSGYPEGAFRGVVDGDGALPAWGLRDLNLDGALDIVVTQHPDVAAVGTVNWMMHPGSGSGFADAATAFTLPGGYPELSFAGISDTSTASPNWALGTIGNDLVIYEFSVLPEVGNSQWLRHKNTSSSFEGSSSTVSLPPGYPSMEFRYGYDGSSSNPNWSLVDIDGDGDLDLVITGFDGIEGVGEGRWLVHLFENGAFSSNGSTWLIPTFGGNELRYTDDRYSEGTNWDLIDIDGDGPPELVVAYQDGVEGLGDTHWQVYANKGNAFSTTPTDWSLPAGLTGLTWAVDRSDDGLNWTLADLQGDGVADLVVTYGGEGANGTGRWEVYANRGNGFSSDPDIFLLPNGLPSGSARRFTSSDFVVTDVDGDGLVDFMVGRNSSSTDADLGVLHWHRHSAVCD
jgi:hypothetical protein